MFEGISLKSPLFVNTAAHLSGVLLFGVLILLLIRGWRRCGDRQRGASLTAALLAFGWNVGSLIGLAAAQRDGRVPDWLVATNFSVLSFLPPVLFRIVLRDKHAWLVRAGYLLAGVTVALHFLELRFPQSALHETALLLITVGFPVLVGAAFLAEFMKADLRLSVTDAVCLLLFTFSFLHFGFGHSDMAWQHEVTLHHAGIPLALIVLLRDYRFLLLEAFVRFLANFSLAGLYAATLYWANQSGQLIERARGSGFVLGILLVAFCCSLLLFSYLRTLAQKQLTLRLFWRGDLSAHMNRILQISSESRSEKELLARTAPEMAALVSAERVEVLENPANQKGEANRPWAELRVPLRFSRGDSALILLGQRSGSRRYLPEDVDALTSVAALITEQVERFRASELQRLAREAELRALQAQINPHFLFNALNTLYGIIGREAFQARRFVLNLAELFRYCLHPGRTLIPLGEEMTIVEAYLEIESLRLGDRLQTEISIAPEARSIDIPVLSLQTLVENAVKHGIARLSANGKLRIIAENVPGFLVIAVEDNGPGFQDPAPSPGLRFGLANVRQRLELCYGTLGSLDMDSTSERTRVSLTIPVEQGAQSFSPDRGSTAASMHPTAVETTS